MIKNGFTCRGCSSLAMPTRRSFLACAGGGAAGALCPALGISAQAHPQKVRVGLVFLSNNRARDSWPYPGFPCEKRHREIIRALSEGCPEVAFVPVVVSEPKDVPKALSLRDKVQGYLIYTVTLHWSLTGPLTQLGSTGKPTLIANEFLGGCGVFLGGLSRLLRKKAPVVGISTVRLSDLVEVCKTFKRLGTENLSAEAFAEYARAAYRATFGSAKVRIVPDETLKLRPISACLKKFRSSRFLIVGRGRKGQKQNFLGATGIYVGFEELLDLYRKVDRTAAQARAEQWIKEAVFVKGPEQESIVRAARLSYAVEKLLERYRTDSITMNCLGGFAAGVLPAYPCLGFMELLDAGKHGVCEAMPDDTLSMLMGRILTGRPGFVSDPTIDTSQRRIVYAHCMATRKVFGPEGPKAPFRIRTLHNLDPRGCCPQTLLPEGYPVTSFRTNFRTKSFVIHKGTSLGFVEAERGCRTKLGALVEGDIEKLFRHWDHFGWHRVTVYGDVAEPLTEFARALGLKVVKEA